MAYHRYHCNLYCWVDGRSFLLCFLRMTDASHVSILMYIRPSFSCGDSSIRLWSLAMYVSIVSRVGTSFVPGRGIVIKLFVSVWRRASRWCCKAMLFDLCCTASTSSSLMACFMFSMCLLRMAFCSSYSVFCLRNLRSSASRALLWELYLIPHSCIIVFINTLNIV